MRRLYALVLVLALLPAVALGQTTRISTSATLPAACTVGSIYVKTGASPGLYVCLALNTWTGPLVTAAAAIADADKGDITTSASGATWTIDNAAVTLAKQANLAEATIQGRAAGAGAGVPTALTATQVRTITDVPTNAEAILDALIDAKGDLIVGSAADTPARLAVGTNTYVLTADSGEATGMKWAAAAAGLSDADYSDITVSSTGTVMTIDNDAVTYAKMQNTAAASKLLGRGSASGAGNLEEIGLGDGLVMSGTTLSSSGIVSVQTTLLTSGTGATYTVPAGVYGIRVRVQGAGGGGGGGDGNTANFGSGAGGDGGAYAEKSYTVAPGQAFTYTIGAGGTGGVAGNNAGSNGGASTFDNAGAIVTANGGVGGGSMAAGTTVTNTVANTKATASGGEVNVTGTQGLRGWRLSGTQGLSGHGAASILGGQGGIGGIGTDGQVGSGYGSGGGGGASITTTDRAGGDGAPGVIVVNELSSGGGLSATSDGDYGDITVSSAGGVWTIDRTFGPVSMSVLTSGTGATYTVPAGVHRLRVRVQGPGGGGGGGDQAAAASGAGAGGGSGGYSEKLYSTTPGATFTYTIGLKGAGGLAGNNAGSNGTANTVFDSGGTPVTGALGSGGASMANGTTLAAGSGGAPGTATGGSLNIPGQTGDQSLRTANNVYRSGKGGDSPLGHPGPYATSGAGAAGVGYGSGGAGGSAFSGSADVAGGDGADGVIIVEEYN